jgi:hypothetical protein
MKVSLDVLVPQPWHAILPPYHPTLTNGEQLVTTTMLHSSGWAVSVPRKDTTKMQSEGNRHAGLPGPRL